MTNEFAERRRKIIGFLNGLSQREKLMVLACLCNDAAIHAKIPDLSQTVFDMQRAQYRAELLAMAEPERSNLDLRLLARRKGCRLEPTKARPTSGALFLLMRRRSRSRAPGTTQSLLRSRAIRLWTSCAPYLTSAGRPRRHRDNRTGLIP